MRMLRSPRIGALVLGMLSWQLACVDAPEEVRFDIFYGMSNNRTLWLDLSNAKEKLGWEPQDRAEDRLPEA